VLGRAIVAQISGTEKPPGRRTTIAGREKVLLNRAATARRGALSQYDGLRSAQCEDPSGKAIAMQAVKIGAKLCDSRGAIAAALVVAAGATGAGSAFAEPKSKLRAEVLAGKRSWWSSRPAPKPWW
jgi:hypothetical protein